MIDNISEPMVHAGVLGMKWGKRKGTSAKKVTKVKSKPAPLKPKLAKDMTEDELRAAIGRKYLEKQYNELQPKKVNHGKELVKSVAISYAKTTANQFIANAGKRSGDALFKVVLKAFKLTP